MKHRHFKAFPLTLATVSLAVCGNAPAWGQSFEQTPGMVLAIDLGALPAPFATPNVSNGAQSVSLPPVPQLRVPAGFTANIYAQGLAHARSMRIAANGDVFLAQSNAGRITLLRDTDGDGRADVTTTFTQGFDYPHGMALQGGFLYVADRQGVWRVPYTPGATAAGGARAQVTSGGALGDPDGHATRNLAINSAGTKMYVAIGSRSNVSEEAAPRATIQEFNINGTGQRTFTSGLRNPVGLAFRPGTDELFTVVNERDGLGDELVPDYLTRVQDGEFYGWPYSYMGSRPQPQSNWSNPQAQALINQARVPDLPFRSHSAPLGLAFYTAARFPATYQGGAFVALHGSWNAAQPRGYMVAYAPFAGGRPTGNYQVFASGFWTGNESNARVMGRPADVAVASDGALLIADDTANVIWRVAYAGGNLTYNSVLATAGANQSFLRFFNGGTVAGAVSLTLWDSATGQNLATWTSPPIQAGASTQFAMSAILGAATPAVSASAHPLITVDVRSAFNGFSQHVMWDGTTGAIENMSRCGGGPSADGSTVMNVHSHRLAGYPSYLRIYNAGGQSGPARLVIRDAASGQPLATWTSPMIPNFAAVDVPIATIEAGASPSLTATSALHYAISVDGTFTGYLQHVVRNTNGALSEMTDKCALTAQ